ncbi:ADP-ribosylation/Crystallin J1 [Mycolicibacterium rhodesiae JS60]|nr:ADP-ribosylation/Crystallin J1 [Mycolicibacterium rhodesiae JS60]
MATEEDRISGGLYGLLVGDALGVPYEFTHSTNIPEHIDYTPPPGFRRAHPGVPAGTWSDDGAQALCLLASLLDQGHLDVDDFGRRLLDWLHAGYLAVDNRVFDVGIQTSTALAALRNGTPATHSGPAGERDNGNGSLMRVLPLALWHHGDTAHLAADAMAQSRVTHGHTRSQVCCALYCLWARRTLQQHPDPWAAALKDFTDIYPPGTDERAEFDTHIAPPAGPPRGRGSGYVVDCLHSAHDCVDAGTDYASVVTAAIRLGDDTDTTAAVAGGIAGIQYGFSGIPDRWVQALRGKDLLEPLHHALLRTRPR